MGVRRKPGTLLPLELAILEVALDLARRGVVHWHGFVLARALAEREHSRRLTAHGTLYKALERLEQAGLLASEWEDPLVAAAAGRPRRRLYRITAAGETALAARSLPSLRPNPKGVSP